MDNRPTIELQLPECGATVLLFTFLTNGQLRDIQRKTLAGVKVQVKQGEGEETNINMGELPAEIVYEAQDLTLDFLVKEIRTQEGTVIENKKEFIYNLSKTDGDLLYSKADEVSKPGATTLSEAAKKK